MKWHLVLALGGPAQAIAGLQLFGEPQLNDGVVCYTYLSTYLVAIASETAEPDFPSLPSFPTTRGIVPPFFSNRSTTVPPSAVTEASEINENPATLIDFTTSDFAITTDEKEEPAVTATDSGSVFLPTLVTSTEATPTSSEPVSGQAVIFFVSPQVDNDKRDIFKRSPGGFIGDGNTNVDICTNAVAFRLGDGQLFDLQDPINYDGESYKQFRSEGAPPEDAITTEFSNVAGTLVFSNRALPNTNAGFCQDKSGQVYITFTSSPPGCVPISLRVYAVEQCQNGQIIGLDPAETATTEPTQPSTIAETMKTALTKTATFPEDISSTAVPSAQLSQSSEPFPETTEITPSFNPGESSTSSLAGQATPVASDSSPEDSSSILFTTSIETPIVSESFISLLSSFTTTASSDFFPPASTLSSDFFSSTDTFASEPTSTLTIESSAESAITSEESSTITDESTVTEESTTTTEEATTTAAEKPTTTTTEESTTTATEGPTTTTEEATSTTTEEPTTTTGCNSVDPLTTVALASPTPLFSDDIYRDEGMGRIIVPWDGGLAGTSQSHVFINTNGYISTFPEIDPLNQQLPSDFIHPIAFLPYWDDLVLDPTKGHTIVYEFSQGNLGTQLTIEFILGKVDTDGIYHFEAIFFEESSNSAFFRYYTTPEKGSSATVGFQNLPAGRSAQASYNQADNILDGEAIFLSLDQSDSFLFFGFDSTECGIGQAVSFP